jgi:hypothetical protein
MKLLEPQVQFSSIYLSLDMEQGAPACQKALEP